MMKHILFFTFGICICYGMPTGNVNVEVSLIKAIFFKIIKEKCYQNLTETDFQKFQVLADNSTECFKNKLTQSPIFVTPLKDFKDKIQGCYDDLIEELENCLPEGEKDWPQINFDMVYSLIDFSYENKDQLISSKFRNYFMNCVENFHDAEAKVELMRCFSGNESNSLEIKKMCEMMTGVEKCTITQLDKTCPTDGSMDTLKVKFFAALREPCTEYMMTENLTDNIFKVLASYTPPNLNSELI